MNNVSELHRQIQFSIDGRDYTTTEHRQPAHQVLRLAGLDPALFDLGEVKGQRPNPVRYSDETVVVIREKARFVSIRHRADVA